MTNETKSNIDVALSLPFIVVGAIAAFVVSGIKTGWMAYFTITTRWHQRR